MKFRITENDVFHAVNDDRCPLEICIERALREYCAMFTKVTVNLLTAHVLGEGVDTHLVLTYNIKQALTAWDIENTPPIGEWELDNEFGSFDDLVEYRTEYQ